MRIAIGLLLFAVVVPIGCAGREAPPLDEARALTPAKTTPSASTPTSATSPIATKTDAPADEANASAPPAAAQGEAAEDPWSAYHVMPGKDVLHAIGPVQGKVKACVVKGLAEDPAASGHVRIRFVVRPTGEVLDWKDEASTPAEDPITKCVGELVKSLRFPEQKVIGNSLGLYTLDVSN
jgi:hypothetical protein